jgi:phage tail sheath protein FI
MPSALSYPGVYIEEIPSGVRTITGVATSITAFVGFTTKGTPDLAVTITSYADFERTYGGLHRDSPVSYAVRQFYANGGAQAVIVRVATGYASTRWQLDGSAGAVLDVEASSPGTWASALRITVDRAGARNPLSEFNLVVSELQSDGLTLVALETHRNLNMNQNSAQYAVSVVNNASSLVRLARTALVFAQRGYALSAAPVAAPLNPSDGVIAGTLNGSTPFQLTLLGTPWNDIAALLAATTAAINAAGLGASLSANRADADGTDNPVGDFLKVVSSTVGETSRVSIAGGAFGGLAAAIQLGLANGGAEFNGDAEHQPLAVANVAPSADGVDGTRAGPIELIGNEAAKTGIHALLDVDLFNLLSIPETFDMTETNAISVMSAAAGLCESRRAFYLADLPSLHNYADFAASAPAWPAAYPQTRNGAAYFPAVRISDPLDGLRLRSMAPSGTVAGIYARTDASRGLWKAPAGTDATMNGVVEMAQNLTDRENGVVNPLGLNVLRSFPAYGRIVWGARTMRGSDAQADEYKYVPVRRLALFLEESLFRGTQWVVFEPNDEPLWAQIRLNIGAFMQNLFRQGAFQGRSVRARRTSSSATARPRPRATSISAS